MGDVETRGGETPGDWQCGTAAARAAEILQYIKDTYGNNPAAVADVQDEPG